MSRWFWNALFGSAALLLFSAPTLPAQETNDVLKEVSPGIYQLGKVRLDAAKKTVRFPASVNMTNGMVEYFLVNGVGKLHESVLKTDVEPAHIHVGMLFLGAAVSTNQSKTNLVGDKFGIEIEWKANGGFATNSSAESFVWNTRDDATMRQNGWIYNGSKTFDGVFIAQRDGSIVSIITDLLALANGTSPDRDNDEIWRVNTNSVPPFNQAVDVIFKLQK